MAWMTIILLMRSCTSSQGGAHVLELIHVLHWKLGQAMVLTGCNMLLMNGNGSVHHLCWDGLLVDDRLNGFVN